MILYPAIDIRGGQGRAAHAGRFDARDRLRRRPARGARSRGSRPARAFLHVVDLDGAQAGAPASIEHLRRIVAEHRRAGPVRRRAAHRRRGPRRAARRRGARDRRHGRATRRRLPRRGRRGATAARGRRVGRRARRADRDGGLDPDDRAAGRRRVRPPAAPAASRSFVYTDADRDGTLEGPALDEVRGSPRRCAGRFLYAGGIGDLDDLRALRALRQVNLVGVIVGKALYERQLHGRRGAGGARREEADGARRPVRVRRGPVRDPAARCARSWSATAAAAGGRPATRRATRRARRPSWCCSRDERCAGTRRTNGAAASARAAAGASFWQADGETVISVTAGTLDQPTGLETVAHIYVDSAGDYEVLRRHRAPPDDAAVKESRHPTARRG